ncbi:MAG: hypothetical protein IPH78_03035 [Bacteroidetes bacterium]|nr:hypothetical protein [Bacteroidota bacterium]
MWRKTVFSTFLLFTIFSASAQKAMKKSADVRDYLYKKEISFGLRLQSNGFSLYGEYGWIKDIYKTRLIQIEYNYFVNYQQKRTKSLVQNGRAFNFGVQNRFHAIRVSGGIKRTIADKAARNGVRLSYSAFGGISLGLVKPYYLMLVQPTDGVLEIKPERYSEGDASRFLSLDSIVQAAPIRYGLGQIEPVPGIHGKFSLDFDWGSRDQMVKALEAGIMLDLYYKRIPVMVNKSNRFYQIGLYLAFHLGKRW